MIAQTLNKLEQNIIQIAKLIGVNENVCLQHNWEYVVIPKYLCISIFNEVVIY